MNKEISITGKKIFYRVQGIGKPVMLVHGFGETGEVWNSQVNHLESQYRLIVPDLPGSGRSEITEDMSIEGMAEVLKVIFDKELVALPDSRGDGTAVVIGHSMGGYITLAFAEKYADDAGAFGLFHSTAFADSEEKKATRRKGIEFIKEHGAFEFLKTSTPNLFSPHTKEKSPQLVSSFIESLSDFSAASLIAYYEAMIRRPDRTAVLKNSKVPVLFIMGEHDNAVPMQDGLKQCHFPSKAFIHILHESGHMGMLEETEKANQFLAEFLNGSI